MNTNGNTRADSKGNIASKTNKSTQNSPKKTNVSKLGIPEKITNAATDWLNPPFPFSGGRCL